jgi:hypothetical protein
MESRKWGPVGRRRSVDVTGRYLKAVFSFLFFVLIILPLFD